MLKPKILVIGSSNMDLVVNLPHMPAIGETIITSSIEEIPGGKGANQAYSCAKMGGEITFLTAIGEDSFGKQICNNLLGEGIDINHILISSESPTGVAFIYVNSEGDNSIVVVQGANSKCDSAYLDSKKNLIIDHDYLLAQLEIPYEGAYKALKFAKSIGKITILNPAPAPKYIPDDVLEAIDFITPNETELALLTGIQVTCEKEAISASVNLLERGVKNVVATLGSKGALLANKDEYTIFSVPKVRVIDTTAAGDVFNGAFVTALSKNKSIHESIIFANAAATISVTQKGAQISVPPYLKVMDYLANIPKGRHFLI